MIDPRRPDLVILDMMMPSWGGIAVLEHFRDKSDAPPFIMISANDALKHKTYAQQLGFVHYIHQPFSIENLLALVAENLETTGEAERAAKQRVIRCKCHRCGAMIRCPVTMLSQTGACPRCQNDFLIFPAPPEDEGPRLVVEV